jgi:hypothetical protein
MEFTTHKLFRQLECPQSLKSNLISKLQVRRRRMRVFAVVRWFEHYLGDYRGWPIIT